MDDRLLAPCTADLLRGWTGPVHGYVHRGIPTRAVSIGEFGGGMVMLWAETGDAVVRPADLSLDLSLAECRDRVVRVVAQHLANDGAPRPYLRCLDADSARQTAPAEWYDSADLRLDPNDDTRLPDGSRLVDALALAAVWREVSP